MREPGAGAGGLVQIGTGSSSAFASRKRKEGSMRNQYLSLVVAASLGVSAMPSMAANVCATNIASASALDAGVASSVDGQFHMFYVLNSAGNLARRYGDPANPNGLTFENLLGVAASEPSATSWGSGHVATVVRGGNGALWYLQWDNGSATGWQTLGGTVTWNPLLIATATGQMTAFYRGANKQLYYVDYSGGSWSGHTSLQGVLTSSPVAASWGAGHLAVFTRGQANDLWYRQRTGGTWGPWAGLGGNFSVDPVVVSRGSGLLDVFVRAPNNTISYISYNGSSWGAWNTLGAPATIFNGISEPGAVVTPAGELTVFARGMTLQGHNGNLDLVNVFKRTSTDGGVTWSAWQSIHGVAGLGIGATIVNPEAVASSFTGWTVVAPTGNSSVPMTVCTGTP